MILPPKPSKGNLIGGTGDEGAEGGKKLGAIHAVAAWKVAHILAGLAQIYS